MSSLQGHFLVASPHLDDPNFARTVVLVIQHDDEGAFGLVLNRPFEERLADLWTLESGAPWNYDLPVYLGGPVPGPIVAIHNSEEYAEQAILPGVFISARREAMDSLIQESFCDLRVFHGYSGWGGGQLEDELEAGGWLVSPACAEDVFSDVDQVWGRIARRINLDILTGSMNLKHVPEDPSWN
jgi:putative transcriptional regulator